MNLAVTVAVFPIIFFGELPDKTMFASLLMASRGHPRSVWLGAAGAFLIHVVIAVTLGVGLFHLLPKRVVDAVVAILFLGGAVFAWRESSSEAEATIDREASTHRQVTTTAFVVIFLAELGDLTQILTANLAARYHSAVSVAVGAVLALWSVAAIAVVGGQRVLAHIRMSTVRIVTAVALLALGLYTAWQAIPRLTTRHPMADVRPEPKSCPRHPRVMHLQHELPCSICDLSSVGSVVHDWTARGPNAGTGTDLRFRRWGEWDQVQTPGCGSGWRGCDPVWSDLLIPRYGFDGYRWRYSRQTIQTTKTSKTVSSASEIEGSEVIRYSW